MSTKLNSHAVFIAGAGTEIGKTYFTAALTRSFLAAAFPARALKPVASGVPSLDDPDFATTDTAILLKAQGLSLTYETILACSPWRFTAPLAPNMAAAIEGRSFALHELVSWCQKQIEDTPHDTTLIIEGVGGLMSPITDTSTGLDWLKAMSIPTFLVSGTYLGAISHALTAHETLRRHNVPLLAIVVSESLNPPTLTESVADAIRQHVNVPVICLSRGGECSIELMKLAQKLT